jgi:hypothetical protein
MLLTKTLFLNRFTTTETATILQAGDLSPAIRVYLFKLGQAIDEDTEDATTIAGLQALEASGLLGEGRAAKILNLGYAKPLPPFDAIGDRFEIVEIRADGTAILQVENERIGFSAGNYEVIA